MAQQLPPIVLCHSYESIVALCQQQDNFSQLQKKELHHLEMQTAITSHTDLGFS